MKPICKYLKHVHVSQPKTITINESVVAMDLSTLVFCYIVINLLLVVVLALTVSGGLCWSTMRTLTFVSELLET